MNSTKGDRFIEFILEMQESKDYLKISDLKDGHSYKIYARNAYVGIWISTEKSFLISRYKVGPNPYLFHEYHWDTGEPFGTAKPIKLIEKCPFVIKEDYNRKEEEELLKYLDNLEELNPIIDCHNSLQERRMAATNFERRLAGKLIN
jgi:hypothetical protein